MFWLIMLFVISTLVGIRIYAMTDMDNQAVPIILLEQQ